jgi:hypothetical protein
MKVRRVTNLLRLNEIIVNGDNRMLLPINDGNGNLIIGLEVLDDPIYRKIHDVLLEITEEIDYVPLGNTIEEASAKIEQIKQAGTLMVVNSKNEVQYGSVKIAVREVKDIAEPLPKEDDGGGVKGLAFNAPLSEEVVVEEPKGVIATMSGWATSSWNWVTGLFK